MPHENQGPGPPFDPGPDDPPARGDDFSAPAAEPAPALEPAARPAVEIGQASRGLPIWLGVLVAFGLGGLLLGQQELAALTAIAGLFVAAQAADLDPAWTMFYYLISWVVPVGSAIAFIVLGASVLRSGLDDPMRAVVIGTSCGSALIALLTIFRPFSNGLVGLLFRTHANSHSLRLAARLVLFGLLFTLPAWFAFRYVLQDLLDDSSSLFEHVALGGGLVGYVVLALASVGFMIRRGLRDTLERLGIRPMTLAHLGVVIAGVVVLFTLNNGADWVQRTYFPGLWESDHQINEALAGNLGVAQTLLLGLSAGVGEEITMRGALQPKLGLIGTSLLFAALHVQYSWFGMLVIFVLGLILGSIRSRTSTTVVMTIHAIYDVLAVLTT